MVLKLFTTFIVVAAILASPKHRDFTWSYRSSIYRVHCSQVNGFIKIPSLKRSLLDIVLLTMFLFIAKMMDHLLGGIQDVIQHRGRYYWKVTLSFELSCHWLLTMPLVSL